MADFPHAVQLYTVRDQAKQYFPGVLRTLKEMGWSGVQISGLHGYPLTDIVTVVKETGLGVAGMHVPLDRPDDGSASGCRRGAPMRGAARVAPSLAAVVLPEQ